MKARLMARDLALLIYVLWPAALLAIVIWVVFPRAQTLATARGTLDQKRSDLQFLRENFARNADITIQQARLEAEAKRLRRMVVPRERSFQIVLVLQRLLLETGHTVDAIRVEGIEQSPESAADGGPRAFVPIEVTATGSYGALVRFLRRLEAGGIPLKLTQLEARREQDSGGLRVKLRAKVFLQLRPTESRQ